MAISRSATFVFCQCTSFLLSSDNFVPHMVCGSGSLCASVLVGLLNDEKEPLEWNELHVGVEGECQL